MLDKFNKPTADAFCEFSNMEEASWSCTKNNMPLGKQDINITVQTVLREEMTEALGVISQLELPVHPLGLVAPPGLPQQVHGLIGSLTWTSSGLHTALEGTFWFHTIWCSAVTSCAS
jgi:hypothetical protein